MRRIILLSTIAFCLFSCQQDFQDVPENDTLEEVISVRNGEDCEQVFTPGNVWNGLIGNEPLSSFDDPGWYGTFEQEFFPCPISPASDECCNESVTINYGQIDSLPFSTTCNTDLDAQELQSLANTISNLAYANLPVCDGITLNPISINVILDITSCCVYDAPCPSFENPCDCYEQYPNSFYWGCCESYYLSLEVKYARTTPCLSPVKGGNQ